MLSQTTLKEYRDFIEVRILLALAERTIALKGDVTRTITQAVADLGTYSEYGVSFEGKYADLTHEDSNRRWDVLWVGDNGQRLVWEIDRSLKPRSIEKLAGLENSEKVWVVWARKIESGFEADERLNGFNLIVLSYDVRTVVWERLLAERKLKRELQHILCQRHRYHAALRISGSVGNNPSGEFPGYLRKIRTGLSAFPAAPG
jgi:hypothetical protein